MSGDNMKKLAKDNPLASRPKLDFSKGVRGKHLVRMNHGTNVVVIAPDLLDAFPNSEAVNEALRALKSAAQRVGTVQKRGRKVLTANT